MVTTSWCPKWTASSIGVFPHLHQRERLSGAFQDVQILHYNNKNVTSMLPVSGNWVDFTGFQKETNHLSMSWNTQTHHIINFAMMLLHTLHTFVTVKREQNTWTSQKLGIPLNIYLCFIIQFVFTFSSSHVQGRPWVVVPLLHVHGWQCKPE